MLLVSAKSRDVAGLPRETDELLALEKAKLNNALHSKVVYNDLLFPHTFVRFSCPAQHLIKAREAFRSLKPLSKETCLASTL